MSLYKQALKQKIRFNFKGSITTEDLWDLDVNQLDTIYRELIAAQSDLTGVSLLNNSTNKAASDAIQLKIDIIKDIVADKVAEIESRKAAASNKAKRDQLNELIARKQQSELENKSIEELEAMRDALK